MNTEALERKVVLDRVREYRSAARKIVEASGATVHRRCVALVELAERARAETDLTTRTWSERSIWEESRAFLGFGDEPTTPPAGYESAQRPLRSQGLEQCPTCRSRLATEEDFARWGRLRLADAERRENREKAVEP